MSRSEFDANQALLAIADDPLEQTQRMPVADRRYRQNEARQAYSDGVVDEAIDRQRWPDFRDYDRASPQGRAWLAGGTRIPIGRDVAKL